jgi:CheY-like chemotaxis protein
VLDRLKADPGTRHVPVCVISTDEAEERAYTSFAALFCAKPLGTREELDRIVARIGRVAQRPPARIVIADPDAERRQELVTALRTGDHSVAAVGTEREALEALGQGRADLLITTGGLDLTPRALAPVLEGRELPLQVLLFGDDEDPRAWREPGDDVVARRVQSIDRLVDLATLVLHAPVADLPADVRRTIQELHGSDRALAGKTVLIVDDDMRNIFALAAVLEDREMHVLSADNGRDAIEMLRRHPGVDVVLMDIMMPEMDGIATMQAIRSDSGFRDLPIIAVTAKAMKGDREKCIEAGAWDYLAKPVDTERLLAVLRAWLHR